MLKLIHVNVKLIPVAAWSKAWFCGRLFAEIAGLNFAGGMDVCLSVVRIARCQSPPDNEEALAR
jgi:hypothetical protein